MGTLAYAIILGDSASAMASLAGATGPLASPNAFIGLISVAVLLPLCLMRDLSSLAFGSILGTLGTVYTALFMGLRYLDGSYAVGGAYHAAIEAAARPTFAAAGSGSLVNLNVLVLVSMLATTFLAHYNAPKFYDELAPPKDGTSKLGRFNLAVGGGFGLAGLLCISIMSAGFLTFGGAAKGFILNNYATADPLAFVARLGIFASVTFSYPLLFVGLRDGAMALVGLSEAAKKPAVHRLATVVLITIVNGLACFMKDLGLVTALGGAILGSTIVYVLPALMSLSVSRKQKSGKLQGKPMGSVETAFNYAMLPVGAFLAVVGAWMTLRGAAH